MKVAFIAHGDPNNMKGKMINIHERALRLKELKPHDMYIDYFMLRPSYSLLFSILKKDKRSNIKIKEKKIDSITYINLWAKRGVLDQLLTFKLKLKGIISQSPVKRIAKKFKDYDLIISHGFGGNYLGYEIYKKHRIPYITSWHGSDINIYPFKNKKTFALIKEIIENAEMNVFVSKALMNKSDEVTTKGKKEYIYTGVNKAFYKYPSDKVKTLKTHYDVTDKQVIGFIGNIIPVKNIQSLPKIVDNIYRSNKNIVFWIIGNGSLEAELMGELNRLKLPYKMFGKKQPNEIPDLMNCMDILLLPSLNEGLPLVTIEALSCNVNVVGSNVGGVPEIIGKKNTFPLDPDFEKNVSKRVLEILKNHEKPNALTDNFTWNTAIRKIILSCNTYAKKK